MGPLSDFEQCCCDLVVHAEHWPEQADSEGCVCHTVELDCDTSQDVLDALQTAVFTGKLPDCCSWQVCTYAVDCSVAKILTAAKCATWKSSRNTSTSFFKAILLMLLCSGHAGAGAAGKAGRCRTYASGFAAGSRRTVCCLYAEYYCHDSGST